ncbi:MAG: ATP-binding cassette domain-containing protein [Rhizobiaceae bacterium]
MLESARPLQAAGAAAPQAGVRPVAGTGLVIERDGRRLLDVDGVSFDDRRLIAIVGPNGAGKTLLMKVLAGVLQPDSGTVTWAGRPPSREGYRKLALVLQAPVLLRRTALANVVYALKAAGVTAGEADTRAMDALERAGLSHLARSSARLLSGGEKQRLALARALAIEPEMLVLDEPTANLDPASAQAIETMVGDALARGVTIVLVTHDMAQARRLADDVVFMHRGCIVETGKAVDFFAKPRTALARAFLSGEIIT